MSLRLAKARITGSRSSRTPVKVGTAPTAARTFLEVPLVWFAGKLLQSHGSHKLPHLQPNHNFPSGPVRGDNNETAEVQGRGRLDGESAEQQGAYGEIVRLTPSALGVEHLLLLSSYDIHPTTLQPANTMKSKHIGVLRCEQRILRGAGCAIESFFEKIRLFRLFTRL